MVIRKVRRDVNLALRKSVFHLDNDQRLLFQPVQEFANTWDNGRSRILEHRPDVPGSRGRIIGHQLLEEGRGLQTPEKHFNVGEPSGLISDKNEHATCRVERVPAVEKYAGLAGRGQPQRNSRGHSPVDKLSPGIIHRPITNHVALEEGIPVRPFRSQLGEESCQKLKKQWIVVKVSHVRRIPGTCDNPCRKVCPTE